MAKTYGEHTGMSQQQMRLCRYFTQRILPCLLLLPSLVGAADVGLAGVFPGKALLTINGGTPRTVAVGVTTDEGVKVLAVGADNVTLDVNGKRRVLQVGQNVASQSSADGSQTATLKADGQGHFFTTGTVNNATVRFFVDTGASMISIGATDAQRIGLKPEQGKIGYSQTANGVTQVARVKLDTVRVGDVVLHNVDAVVHQQDMPFVLLGMSFLNRMEMQRTGDTMTLKKRY